MTSESRRASCSPPAVIEPAAACGATATAMGTSSPGSAAGAGGPSSAAGLPLSEGASAAAGLLANESSAAGTSRPRSRGGPGAVRVPRRAADGRARLHARARGRPIRPTEGDAAHPLREPDCRPALDVHCTAWQCPPNRTAIRWTGGERPTASTSSRSAEQRRQLTGTTPILTCTPPNRWRAAWLAPSSPAESQITRLPDRRPRADVHRPCASMATGRMAGWTGRRHDESAAWATTCWSTAGQSAARCGARRDACCLRCHSTRPTPVT